MKLPISQRLLTCAQLAAPGGRVADVGTDHGYLGIYLLQQGLADHILAADLRPQPLEKAKANFRAFGLEDRVDFYLSDGLAALPHEIDTVVCAGMGADTIVSILTAAPWLRETGARLVLQPQSSANDLHRYLASAGWQVERERLCRDGRFYYTVLRAAPGQTAPLSSGEEFLSPALRASGSPLLGAYCDRCIRILKEALAGLRSASREVDPEQIAYFSAALAELTQWREQQ